LKLALAGIPNETIEFTNGQKGTDHRVDDYAAKLDNVTRRSATKRAGSLRIAIIEDEQTLNFLIDQI
jgi:hypothetical protein